MSSGVRCRARAKSSGRSRRVTSWASQARSARARASPALYQCRLLALTLPTTTLFRNTAPAAMSAAPGPVVEPPLPTPVRHTMPPAPMNRIDHLADTCAFDDNVRFEPDAGNAPRAIARPESADEFRLGARINLIEDVNIQAALLPEEGSEKTDRPRPGYQYIPGLPEGALADRRDLLPGLGDDSGGLQENPEEPEKAVHLHRVLGFDPPALGHEAVDLLDAPLGVLAIAAHVPLTHRAVRARDGVWTADDPHHQIALPEPADRARVNHAAQGFVAQHKARLAARSPAVLAF